MDEVFKALADPTRRSLLDELFREDGQSLSALEEHFGVNGPRVSEVVRFQPVNIRVHQTADPEVIITEFEYAGRNTENGREFVVPNIFVLRVRDGHIVESRDYAHHRAFDEAMA